MHIEHLPLTQQLTPDSGAHLPSLIGAHIGQNRVAILWRGGQGGHFPQPTNRHFQRARDGGGGHGQHIHIRAHSFEGFFMLHPKALLLIDNYQPQVFKFN